MQDTVFTIHCMSRGEELARWLFTQHIALLSNLNQVCGVGLSMCELQQLKLDTYALRVSSNVVGQVLSELGLCMNMGSSGIESSSVSFVCVVANVGGCWAACASEQEHTPCRQPTLLQVGPVMLMCLSPLCAASCNVWDGMIQVG